ncbi:MAG: ParB/RepB/Spo0J family partition protein [Clostridia bacterium]|nr:ParB/RepB/Spo0J family partition protein [Clostridia bacterium]
MAENPFQPRRTFEELSLFSLANSIREHGILQPLTVRRITALTLSPGADEATGEAEVIAQSYELIAGERRLRAAAAIGMECVPCIVLEADNRRAAELALIENLQRESLNMFEQAAAIAALIDMHAMTQEEIARSLAVSQPTVANKLRILRLTTAEREIILSHHLTERHARAFLRIRDLGLRREAVEYTASHGLNVAQSEDYIDGILARAEAEKRVPTVPASAPQSSEAAETGARSVSQKTSAQGAAARQKTLVLRDFSVFFNTVERAIAAVRESGIAVRSTKEETAGEIRYTVILPRGGGDGGASLP